MIKVKLRKKPITDGRSSLYLDYYPAIPHPDTGKPTRREFLGMYVFDKPRKILDKEQNKQMLELAETIRAQRQIDVQKGAYGFLSGKQKETCFVKYFEEQAGMKTGSNADNWQCALLHLKNFAGSSLRVADLTVKKCEAFRDYLLTTESNRNENKLSQNTALSYFNKFKAALKQAYKDGLLKDDINAKVSGIKSEETNREYLTLQELQALVKTGFSKNPELVKAAIFSALTGLRFSDITRITWGQIRQLGEGEYAIQFTQQKTKGVELLPVSAQAVSILGNRKGDNECIIQRLDYSTKINNHLRLWAKEAGIKKHLTFHCFRHTYATLQLTLGTDIYTVSKMLGHRELKTTQIYAKIVDEKKREAASRINLDI
ncbi:site-specific integrase [Arsenicibacter rosenii]|uniref:Integrase n=1 Tax=Arsenicibacter rosenii TaxID=1750698 RepID=A0A1S2VGW2_9BACT|nr:site-specific integrase [Arsenicibacter rosenii]OIN58007.1 integrase [Arsenicibacter rosenii]